MMIKVDETLTRNVAELAKLELSPDEVRTFTAQLGDILGYVDQLQDVNIQGVEPLLYPLAGSEAVMRDDVEKPSLVDPEGRPRGLESAPDVLNDGFKVPPIL